MLFSTYAKNLCIQNYFFSLGTFDCFSVRALYSKLIRMADAKPEEKKPADAKPEEKKPEEKKPADAKPEEKKPTDAKSEVVVAILANKSGGKSCSYSLLQLIIFSISEPAFQMKIDADKLSFKSDKLTDEPVAIELKVENSLAKRQTFKVCLFFLLVLFLVYPSCFRSNARPMRSSAFDHHSDLLSRMEA